MRLFWILASFLLVTACTSQRDQMVQDGFPLSYADGFADGCHSGKKAGGALFEEFKKDVTRFSAEAQYAQGWSDGFRQCELEEEAQERSVRTAIQSQQMQNYHKDVIGPDFFNGMNIDTDAINKLK
ncbi:MAG: hypothetical protein V7723_17015 [Sneathiella sp.]|uniref:hypothetical protein n=1 Tax=Sneathiella sp. TaxID=1964365 RepID=UPI0030013A49